MTNIQMLLYFKLNSDQLGYNKCLLPSGMSILVIHFPVRQIPVGLSPSFSSPAFSAPPDLSLALIYIQSYPFRALKDAVNWATRKALNYQTENQMKLQSQSNKVNHLKFSVVRQLHLKVFNVIHV